MEHLEDAALEVEANSHRNWARRGSSRYFILRDTFENDLIPRDGGAFCSARYQPEIICVHGVAKILLRYEWFRPCIIQIFTRRVHVR